MSCEKNSLGDRFRPRGILREKEEEDDEEEEEEERRRGR